MSDVPDTDGGAVAQPATTLVLNNRFIESIGEERLPDYIATVVALVQQAKDGSTVEVTQQISETLDAHGFPIPPIEAERLAEQLIRAGGGEIAITRGDGRVLHGAHPGVAAADPGVAGSEDPEASERPTYS